MDAVEDGAVPERQRQQIAACVLRIIRFAFTLHWKLESQEQHPIRTKITFSYLLFCLRSGYESGLQGSNFVLLVEMFHFFLDFAFSLKGLYVLQGIHPPSVILPRPWTNSVHQAYTTIYRMGQKLNVKV